MNFGRVVQRSRIITAMQKIKARLFREMHKISFLNDIIHSIDRHSSKNTDISKIHCVCLTLGPYRNLTTLTASIIALHPYCQVLNHAGKRIFHDNKLNFFQNYNEAKFDDFVRYAVYASKKGTTGEYGGSITFSHAFQHGEMRKRYRKRYGNSLMKKEVQCLFWKESLRTANSIKENNVDLGKIFSKNTMIRFLMPIRNPLNCAFSNIKTGHVNIFPTLNKDSAFEEVLAAVLNELKWFLELRKKYPERLFYYFENNFSKEKLLKLAEFLGVEPDRQWCEDALATFKIKSSYDHSVDKIRFYNDFVVENFSAYPELLKHLLKFADTHTL